eukprot:SAG22_NODE_359_length_11758_cov_4.094254_7_plen_218_part_00
MVATQGVADVAELRADVGYQFILFIQIMTSVGSLVEIQQGYKQLTGNAARFVELRAGGSAPPQAQSREAPAPLPPAALPSRPASQPSGRLRHTPCTTPCTAPCTNCRHCCRSHANRGTNKHVGLPYVAELKAIAGKEAGKASKVVESDRIQFKDVDVYTPAGDGLQNKLVHKLSFEVGKSDSLLLTGHNGAGKSSVFRCLGGLCKQSCRRYRHYVIC